MERGRATPQSTDQRKEKEARNRVTGKYEAAKKWSACRPPAVRASWAVYKLWVSLYSVLNSLVVAPIRLSCVDETSPEHGLVKLL